MMKKSTIITLKAIFSFLILLMSCSGKENVIEVYKEDNKEDIKEVEKPIPQEELTSKYYTRYRYLRNKVLTFRDRDQITEQDSKLKFKSYKVFYNKKEQIAIIETYKNGIILKKQIYNPETGQINRIEYFKNGVLIRYSINHYDKETKQLTKQAIFNKNNNLIQTNNYEYGELINVNHYKKEKVVKTLIYSGDELDITRIYDTNGNLIQEDGKYDDNKYKYTLKFFYNKNGILKKVEYFKNGKLAEIHSYNKNGKLFKIEKYNNNGTINKTIKIDDSGSPVETSTAK